jgi:hypothetical protein
VLKGAALAHLVYPEPLLRPMRDIDILVRAEEVYRGYALLPQIGFTPPPARTMASVLTIIILRQSSVSPRASR